MDYATASLDELFDYGKTIGSNVASWVDMPQAGDKCYTEDGSLVSVDNVGLLEDAMLYLAHTNCGNVRDDEESVRAEEINQRGDSEQAWEKFQEGIDAGINENISKRVQVVAGYWFD